MKKNKPYTELLSYTALKSVFPKLKKELYDKVVQLMEVCSIKYNKRMSQKNIILFWACTGHETGGFTVFEENLNYSEKRLLQVFPKSVSVELAKQLANKPQDIANHIYGNRYGNTQPDDGWKYRGRGIIQLTFKANYEKYALQCGDLKVVSEPDLLTTDINHLAGSGVYFWFYSKACDHDDIKKVQRIVNGTAHMGLAQRQVLADKIKKAVNKGL